MISLPWRLRISWIFWTGMPTSKLARVVGHLLKRCIILDGSSVQYFFFILNCSPASALSSNDIAEILDRLSFVCGSCRSFFVLPYEIVARAKICGPTHNPLQVHPQQHPMTLKCSACLGDWESVDFFELACQHPNWYALWVISLKDAFFWRCWASNIFFYPKLFSCLGAII
jgi:hypothetical protein